MQLILGLIIWALVVVGTWFLCEGIQWVLIHIGMSWAAATFISGYMVLAALVLLMLRGK